MLTHQNKLITLEEPRQKGHLMSLKVRRATHADVDALATLYVAVHGMGSAHRAMGEDYSRYCRIWEGEISHRTVFLVTSGGNDILAAIVQTSAANGTIIFLRATVNTAREHHGEAFALLIQHVLNEHAEQECDFYISLSIPEQMATAIEEGLHRNGLGLRNVVGPFENGIAFKIFSRASSDEH